MSKYNVNYEFFKNWTADMAYLLGYITADGCIRPNHGYELKLKSIDYELLEHSRNLLESNHPIKKEKNKNCYIFCVYSKKIISDLLSLGIIPRKSYNMPFPYVPNEFFWDYLRGEVDGDGCIYRPKDKSKQIGMSIVGNEIFLKKLKQHLINKINCKNYALNYNCNDKRICTLPIYSKSAYAIIKKLYANDKYGLSRKKQLAMQVIKHCDSFKVKLCEVCGNEFQNSSNNRRRFCKICKEERCKQYMKMYNKTYIRRDRKRKRCLTRQCSL